MSLRQKGIRSGIGYCSTHNNLKQKVRLLRIPCFTYGCKNTADEDGYCDRCRPFDSTDVPILEGRLKKQCTTLIPQNTPRCPYTGKKSKGGVPYSVESSTEMANIRNAMQKKKE